ncbi:choice-of-anchor Q domain-containing protein [Prosthecobacter sp.]|uniref:choice-of-anchor Q domain-containing protein n=1 Tax=Prosthecobacter sp. TaxID=1965333 RepID=UPI003783469C
MKTTVRHALLTALILLFATAAHAATFTVTNANDAGTGSLRQAVADAAAAGGADTIVFDAALSGQTIALTSAEIATSDTGGVTIDATALAAGVTISGGGARRLFLLHSGTIATFRALTFTAGNGAGSFDTGRGGALYSNQATLTLERCTLRGNAAAGAAGDGGALFANFGSVSLTNCTLTGNSAGFRGGAIFTKGTLSLTHATVTLNGTTSTDAINSGGGGIYDEFAALTLSNSIVAGNTAGSGVPNGKDILCDLGSVTRQGANLVQDYADFGGTTQSGPAFTNAAPNLSALASNGGPTQTLLPNAGSPAIDAAVGSSSTADQRGLSRPQGSAADIGAAEVASLIVQNNADSGSGSLRQTIADAAFVPGGVLTRVITFAPALSGQTITLSSELIPGQDVTIDASALANSVTLSGNGNYRVFNVSAGRTVVFRALRVASGGGQGGGDPVSGGGIYNQGTATLERCTLSGNSTYYGGGIYNSGTLTLTQSTLSGNSAYGQGGGILNTGTLTLTQSTLSGNSASDGGGISNYDTLTLTRTIVAGNTASFTANIFGTFSGSNNLTDGDPLLAPLGNYGGPTQTMPPLPGSPAIDAGGAASSDPTDQRGAPRVADGDGNGSALVDIGAVEVTPAVVTSLADDGAGSLRAVLADAFTSTVFFAPPLGGGTITLTSGHLTLSRSVAIDASGAGGMTISGNSDGDSTLEAGESRIFDIPSGVTVVLRRLNLINGTADPTDVSDNGLGGAIRSSGQLSVDQCTLSACRAFEGAGLAVTAGSATLTQSTLSGNSAIDSGGGISNSGTLTLTQSTLSGNSASDGGGIYNTGTLTLTQNTLSGNSASRGGGIFNFGTLTLTQSTLSGNSAGLRAAGIENAGTLTMNLSIVAGNASPSSAEIYGTFSGSGNLTSGNPLLAPLGNYGGPTQTMPPLSGSPAIDTGGSTSGTTDQRGAPRVVDGDGNGSAFVDLGAVEAIPAIVTSTADSGAGSLRAALSAPSADVVLFDPALGGQTITLTSGQLTPGRSLGIDASALPGGITISGNSDGDNVLEAGESRLFEIPAGLAVTLRGLRLTNGMADPASDLPSGEGGAIRNSGQLTLDLCTLSACRSKRGGAINSTGVLTVGRSTFQQNNATFGGGIHSTGNGLLAVADTTFLMNTALAGRGGAVLENDADSPPGHPTLTRCTFHGNAASLGGAVDSFSLTNLIHCTLSDNSAGNIGGGVLASSTSVVTLTNCVVAGNTNTSGSSPNLGSESTGVYTTAGKNLVGDLTGSGLSAGPTLRTGDPLLAPLGDYGGPTQTRALLPGSPARNAAAILDPAVIADQRGFPISGALPDIGAYETGTFTDYDAWVYETLPAAASPQQRAAAFDFDGDGQTNEKEWVARTDPGSANSCFRVTQAAFSGGMWQITIPTVTGRRYTLQTSPNLADWTSGDSHLGSNGSHTFQTTLLPPVPSAWFYRVLVSDP